MRLLLHSGEGMEKLTRVLRSRMWALRSSKKLKSLIETVFRLLWEWSNGS